MHELIYMKYEQFNLETKLHLMIKATILFVQCPSHGSLELNGFNMRIHVEI